jgi:predicted transcriptional regulator of viral defense system
MAVSTLAEAQYGVVSRAQLVELGLTARAIERRLGAGRLHRLHRGVYAVGHRVLKQDGRWLAAVMSGGVGAALSHRSAAALWNIRRTSTPAIDVTVERALRQRPPVRFHRACLARDEVTTHAGIRVVNVARTLIDLAATLTRHELERAITQAEIQRHDTGLLLNAAVQRHAGRPGVAKLARLLDEGRLGEKITRSELETRFLAFVEESGLPRPLTNQTIEGLEVDCVWPAKRVIVELDGRAFHDTRQGFERDRERDRILQAAGWRVIRITWRQLHSQPAAVRRDLHHLLSAS